MRLKGWEAEELTGSKTQRLKGSRRARLKGSKAKRLTGVVTNLKRRIVYCFSGYLAGLGLQNFSQERLELPCLDLPQHRIDSLLH
jgi:hypothetical protein